MRGERIAARVLAYIEEHLTEKNRHQKCRAIGRPKHLDRIAPAQARHRQNLHTAPERSARTTGGRAHSAVARMLHPGNIRTGRLQRPLLLFTDLPQAPQRSAQPLQSLLLQQKRHLIEYQRYDLPANLFQRCQKNRASCLGNRQAGVSPAHCTIERSGVFMSYRSRHGGKPCSNRRPANPNYYAMHG